MSLIFNYIFLADLIAYVFIFDDWLCVKRPFYRWEAFLQIFHFIVSMFVITEVYAGNHSLKVHISFTTTYIVILMLRMVILIRYLNTFKDGRILTMTAKRLATPFLSILLGFYLLTFEF